MKAISAVIATIMLLMVSVAMIGVFYAFSSTMATTTTSSGSEQAAQLTSQISSCMRIENINGNKVDLKNCGKGVIDSKSLVVIMDDVKLNASLQTIAEGSSGTVNVTGLWQIQPGKHNLKISNGATFAQALVDVSPNDDGLVGSWNFDEGSGTAAYDRSGNGNVGTLNGGISWTNNCFVGTCLNFDGNADYVDIASFNGLPSGAITISAIISINSHKNWNSIVSHEWVGNGWLLYTDSAGIARFGIGQGGTQYNAQKTGLSTNTRYFLTGTYDGSNVRLYVNGVEGTPNPYNNAVLDNNGAVSVSVNSASAFNGLIDEVRIWNKALTPDETVSMKQII